MKQIKKIFVSERGFTLGELLAALIISSMVIIAVFGLYTRLNSVSAACLGKLEQGQLPREILQLIAEDLDRIVSDTKDTKIKFQNKIEKNGLQSARLEITKSIYDKDNNPAVFEQIIWQTSFDFVGSPKGMVLYRRHSGIALEDKLLDEPKLDWERQLYIPVCGGVTLFSVQTGNFQTGTTEIKNDTGQPNFIDTWTADTLPANVIVTISFSDAEEVTPGQWQVPDTEKIMRIIPLDRTRKIPLRIETGNFNAGTKDSNSISDVNKPAENQKAENTKINTQNQEKSGENVSVP
jgi:type II secretory pathway component PulJ